MQLKAQRRKAAVGRLMLALLGGTFGLHRAYLGEWRWMVVYVALCWTGLPTLAGLLEAAYMPRRCRLVNAEANAAHTVWLRKMEG